MRTRIIVVRHGETEWNRTGLLQGQLDSPLTDLGIRQAHALANGLANKRFDQFYCSDLGRALETAQIINDTMGMTIQQEPRLRERHLGIMQGLTKKEFGEFYPNESQHFSSGDPDYVIPEGESMRQRYQRCVDITEDLVNQYTGQTLLFVTHGGFLNSLFYKMMNLSLNTPRCFSLYNASINTLIIKDNLWHLESWGETQHLKHLQTLDDN